MYRKIIAITVLAAMLAGCAKGGAEGSTVTSAEVTAAEISKTETVTTTVTSDTVIYCNESVFEENGAAAEKMKSPTVVPADEVYSVYPKRIQYPEKTETNITAEKAEINEEFKKDGQVVFEFSAVYPVFVGGDGAVIRKINDGVKAYIDEVYEDISRRTEEYDAGKDGEIFPPWHFSMTICALGKWKDGVDLSYDINGNILSVFFYTEDYAGGAHGAVIPVLLTFDLRTGEQINFNEIFEDKKAVINEINTAAYQYFENRWRSGGVEGYESGFEKFEGSSGIQEDYDFDREITVRNGCLSYCTVPYGFGGSFADGMKFMEVAAEDIYPYLNEKGRSLFEGYQSAESEPVNIIEENGKKYFDTEN